MKTPLTTCDLHMHSSASLTTGEWFSKYFGCPESYADPAMQYELSRKRGMTLVTLTDHDTIEGGLQLMDRPGFFLSEEVTTRFPENGCVMHVLAWNITPAQHEDIQHLRENIYELSAYLRSAGIAHALAHPLLSPNWRLDAATLEKCLALFPTLEVVNGTVDRRLESDVEHLARGADRGVLEELSRRHGIPLAHPPGRGASRVAGGDDHTGRRSGTIFTEADGALEPAEFLSRVMAGGSRVAGVSGDLASMAMTVQTTAHEWFRRRNGARGNPFVDVVERLAGRPALAGSSSPVIASILSDSLARAAQLGAVPAGPELDITVTPLEASDELDARYIHALARTSDALLGKAARDLAVAAASMDLYGVLGALAEIGSSLLTVTPYLFAADHFARQWEQAGRLWREWTAFPPVTRPERLAVFSDSVDKVDGVASWCRRFESQARQAGRFVWMARCRDHDDSARPDDGLPAVARFDLPLYAGFELVVPSLAATVDRLWREGTTHVELSTPGPMGLVGLAAARLLRLPVTATYHTELPDLVESLTGDADAALFTRGYVRWFYRSVDRVLAMSAASRARLVGLGVAAERIDLMPVAVDPNDFAPARMTDRVFASLGVELDGRPVVLSVGRISPEKNLTLVIEAVERLQEQPGAPLLVLVGDGPARAELESRCAGKEFVHFVGFQQGEVLRQLYASADVFVFTSSVDTLGLVNLEALASGLPVLVPDDAAIRDSLTDGETAVFYEPSPGVLAETIRAVLADPVRAEDLGRNGRHHAVSAWGGGDFQRSWHVLVRGATDAGGARAAAGPV